MSSPDDDDNLNFYDKSILAKSERKYPKKSRVTFLTTKNNRWKFSNMCVNQGLKMLRPAVTLIRTFA